MVFSLDAPSRNTSERVLNDKIVRESRPFLKKQQYGNSPPKQSLAWLPTVQKVTAYGFGSAKSHQHGKWKQTE